MGVQVMVRLIVTAQWLGHRVAERLAGEDGELSSQQVIWIGALVTIAVTVGGIVSAKVIGAANGLNVPTSP